MSELLPLSRGCSYCSKQFAVSPQLRAARPTPGMTGSFQYHNLLKHCSLDRTPQACTLKPTTLRNRNVRLFVAKSQLADPGGRSCPKAQALKSRSLRPRETSSQIHQKWTPKNRDTARNQSQESGETSPRIPNLIYQKPTNHGSIPCIGSMQEYYHHQYRRAHQPRSWLHPGITRLQARV